MSTEPDGASFSARTNGVHERQLSPDALLDGLDQLPALVERWRAQATS